MLANRSLEKLFAAGRRRDFGNKGRGEDGRSQDVDQALFRNQLLENMASTRQRQ